MQKRICRALLCALTLTVMACNTKQTVVDKSSPTGPSPVYTSTLTVVADATAYASCNNGTYASAKAHAEATVTGQGSTQQAADEDANAKYADKFGELDAKVKAQASAEAVVNCGPGGGTPAPGPGPGPYTPQCRDGVDNDHDGKVDFPADPGCTSPDDDDETDVVSPPPPTPQNPTCSLSANPTTITQGASTTLTWIIENSTSQTVGASPITSEWTGAIAASGSKPVKPTATTTYSITANGAGGTCTQSVLVTVVPASPPTPTITSVDVEPKTASCSVGGQMNFGAVVKGTGNVSQLVDWSISDSTVASQKAITENTIVLDCLKVGTVTVKATAHGTNISDQGIGTVTASGPVCSWTATSGTQPDGSVEMTKTSPIGGTASCSDGSLPAWYSSDPSRVGVKGSSKTTVDGKVYETGTSATITGFALTSGTSVCVQQALTKPSPAYCRVVVVK